MPYSLYGKNDRWKELEVLCNTVAKAVVVHISEHVFFDPWYSWFPHYSCLDPAIKSDLLRSIGALSMYPYWENRRANTLSPIDHLFDIYWYQYLSDMLWNHLVRTYVFHSRSCNILMVHGCGAMRIRQSSPQFDEESLCFLLTIITHLIAEDNGPFSAPAAFVSNLTFQRNACYAWLIYNTVFDVWRRFRSGADIGWH